MREKVFKQNKYFGLERFELAINILVAKASSIKGININWSDNHKTGIRAYPGSLVAGNYSRSAM